MSRLTYKEKWFDSLSFEEHYYNSKDNGCVEKLGRLEDIEEELGCPLEVVFKALKEGIIDIENHEHRYIHLRDNGKYVFPFNCWIFHTFHFSYVFKLSDYQKTWWLKGEKDESCNGTD